VAYALDPGERLGTGLRRVLREQTSEAVERLEHASPDERDEAVHEARKSLKKSRAVLRLARPSLGPLFGEINAAVRDAGRSMSDVRDARVMVGALDKLAEAVGEEPTGDLLGPVRRTLEDRADHAIDEATDGGLLHRSADRIRGAAALVDRGAWEQDGWDAIGDGLRRVYRRGRRAFTAAVDDSDPERMHEWRKRSKDLWYGVRLLRPGWDRLLKATAKEAHELADLLGDDHDLAVLQRLLQAEIGTLWQGDRAEAIVSMADGIRSRLFATAIPLGRRLYAEGPKRFTTRIGRYWDAAVSEARSSRTQLRRAAGS